MKPSARDRIPEDVLSLAASMSCLIKLLDTATLNLGSGEDQRPIQLSCHILARAILKVFQDMTTLNPGKSLVLKDGCFHPNFCHSWLQVGDIVLDVYPVGSIVSQDGGVIIWPIPGVNRHLFLHDDEVSHQNGVLFAKSPYRAAVETVAQALRRISED